MPAVPPVVSASSFVADFTYPTAMPQLVRISDLSSPAELPWEAIFAACFDYPRPAPPGQWRRKQQREAIAWERSWALVVPGEDSSSQLAIRGFALCGADTSKQWLSSLAVDPSLRGYGWGRRLIQKVQDDLTSDIVLEVMSTRRTRSIYLANGFTQLAFRPAWITRRTHEPLINLSTGAASLPELPLPRQLAQCVHWPDGSWERSPIALKSTYSLAETPTQLCLSREGDAWTIHGWGLNEASSNPPALSQLHGEPWVALLRNAAAHFPRMGPLYIPAWRSEIATPAQLLSAGFVCAREQFLLSWSRRSMSPKKQWKASTNLAGSECDSFGPSRVENQRSFDLLTS